MNEYEIKITGSGTREEIAKALIVIAEAIHDPHSNGDGKNVFIGDRLECEDYCLMTEINKK